MEQKMHTIEDILALPEGERAELIDGEMFMMATPTRRHRKIVGWLHAMIFNPKEGLIPRSLLRGVSLCKPKESKERKGREMYVRY